MSLKTAANSAISFVEHLGQEVMHELSNADVVLQKVQPVANFVGNIISAVDPLLAPAVKTILAASSYVEGQFAASGNATGTGSQKLSIVMTMIGDVTAYFLNVAGKASDGSAVEDFISKIVGIGKNDPDIWNELLTMLEQPTAASAAAATPAHH